MEKQLKSPKSIFQVYRALRCLHNPRNVGWESQRKRIFFNNRNCNKAAAIVDALLLAPPVYF